MQQQIHSLVLCCTAVITVLCRSDCVGSDEFVLRVSKDKTAVCFRAEQTCLSSLIIYGWLLKCSSVVGLRRLLSLFDGVFGWVAVWCRLSLCPALFPWGSIHRRLSEPWIRRLRVTPLASDPFFQLFACRWLCELFSRFDCMCVWIQKSSAVITGGGGVCGVMWASDTLRPVIRREWGTLALFCSLLKPWLSTAAEGKSFSQEASADFRRPGV